MKNAVISRILQSSPVVKQDTAKALKECLQDILTNNKPYKNISSAFYIRGFEKEETVGMCSKYMPEKPYMKYYNQFDYVKWFNDGAKTKKTIVNKKEN